MLFPESIARLRITTLVNHPRLEKGVFFGEFRARIDTPDTDRYAYSARLALKTSPARMSGVAVAIGEPEPRVRNALSSWLELTGEA